MLYRLLMIPKLLRSVSDFLYEHRARMYMFAVILVLAGAVVITSLRANELNKKALLYEEQAESLSMRLDAYENLINNSEALSEEVSSLKSEVKTLKAKNEELTADIDVLEEHSEVMLSELRWVREAELREQPEEKFKITFYSTDATYEYLIPGKTVAMNSQQVADLGLKKGDEIYIKSKKEWSGFYKITDSGCAYGTIDIYVEPDEVPSYGVEYDVEILL